ncbi:unnamed protein product [Arabis nemorensis]|uniref:Uncharacterized protein n=1 Tax=Arabis nemorensis TaxID=586526 RepID=A0A565BUT0_9BRAS|nr:unnamed protein product [Arabis nemorensis]
MSSTLRDKKAFTLLGRYDTCLYANGSLSKITINAGAYGSLSCGCHMVDGLLEDFRKNSNSSHWIHMVHDSSERNVMEFDSSSRLHHYTLEWGDCVSA